MWIAHFAAFPPPRQEAVGRIGDERVGGLAAERVRVGLFLPSVAVHADIHCCRVAQRAMGIALTSGRELTRRDTAAWPSVVVVDHEWSSRCGRERQTEKGRRAT